MSACSQNSNCDSAIFQYFSHFRNEDENLKFALKEIRSNIKLLESKSYSQSSGKKCISSLQSAKDCQKDLNDFMIEYEVFTTDAKNLLSEYSKIYEKIKINLKFFDELKLKLSVEAKKEQINLLNTEMRTFIDNSDCESVYPLWKKFLDHLYIHCEVNSSVPSKYSTTFFDAFSLFTEEFRQLLKALLFPVSSAKFKTNEFLWSSLEKKKFSSLYNCLSVIEFKKLKFRDAHFDKISCVPLPMWLIIESLEKRFLYNFYGDKTTNSLEHPEWYMNLVFSWIIENDYTLTCIQDDIDNKQMAIEDYASSFKLDFIQALVIVLLDKLSFDLGSTTIPGSLHFSGLFKIVKEKYVADDLCNLETSAEDSNLALSTPPLSPTLQPMSNFEFISTELTTDPAMFAHLIDSVLTFDSRLTSLSYPIFKAHLVDALSQGEVFQKWLSLEHDVNVEKLNQTLKANDAWLVDVEDSYEPNCIESLKVIIECLSSHFKVLQCNEAAAVQFVTLQLELLELFLTQSVESLNISKSSGDGTNVFEKINSSNSSTFCMMDVMNGLFYVCKLMTEWANDSHYLNLSEKDIIINDSKEEMNHKDVEDTSKTGLFNWSILSDTKNLASNVTQDMLKLITEPLLVKESRTHKFVSDVGIFNSIYARYDEEMNTMSREYVAVIMYDFLVHSSEYVKDSSHWQSAAPISVNTSLADHTSAGLSGSIALAIQHLKNHLTRLHKRLHPKLFVGIWHGVARKLNKYLLMNLILVNEFGPVGAFQLNVDICECIVPLFNYYAVGNTAGGHFDDCIDACKLLNLRRGTAMLMLESLRENVKKMDVGRFEDPLASLQEVGVYHTMPEDAITILLKRNDLS